MMHESERSSAPRARGLVLLAEDDPALRALLCVALRHAGYQVLEAVDGRDLWEFVATRGAGRPVLDAVDVILSDVRMPGVSGLEALRGLREASWPTPVILMTAFDDAATQQAARAHRARLIAKPFDLRELLAMIDASVRGLPLG